MPFLSIDLDALKVDVDELSKAQEVLREEGRRIQAALDCFDNAAFETFRVKVLIPEMQRLERLRMDVASDQIMVHERLVGQWAEANALATRKETLAQDLQMNHIRLQEQGAELAKVDAKFQRELKKRRE